MSYLPKSQMKQNLYTKGGELYYITDNTEYRGYYYVTSQNKFYTGKHPGDSPNDRLRKVQPEGADDFNPNTIPTSKKTTWVYQGSGYNKKLINPPSLPMSKHPFPQNKDYQLGEFERYFLSKNNEIKFIETDQFTYNKYLSQSPDVAYQLYKSFKLSWELTGDKEKVYEVNLKTVKRIERNLELRGFEQYFKGRFTQFYKDTSKESPNNTNNNQGSFGGY